MSGPLHIGGDGIYCNLCPAVVYQTRQLALEHTRLEHPAELAILTAPRHLHADCAVGAGWSAISRYLDTIGQPYTITGRPSESPA